MAVSAGYPLYADGATVTGSLMRKLDAGPAFTDGGSASAVAPLGGVIPGPAANLAVTAPASGMTVSVAPGYAVVPSATSGQGAYYFGLMSSGSLTVASNSSGSTRQDYVLATVTDLGSPSTTAVIQYVTGTTSPPAVPASSIVLAQVAVPNGASSIVTGDITDKRSWVVSRGGILPVAAAGSAPAGEASQFLWDIATGQLMQATGTAGSPVTASLYPATAGFSYVPAGTTVTSTGFGGNTLASVTVTADGQTDYEISVFAAQAGAAGISQYAPGRIGIFMDSALLDSIGTQSTASFAQYPDATWTYFTSAAAGTTPAAGSRTFSLQIQPRQFFFFFGEALQASSPFWIRVQPVAV